LLVTASSSSGSTRRIDLLLSFCLTGASLADHPPITSKTRTATSLILSSASCCRCGRQTFVVDQLQRLNADSSETFAARMDLQRLGMFGHSFGGATALEFCHQDSRCKAALDMDGIPFGSVVPEGLSKPGMFLLSDHSREMADPESRPVLGVRHKSSGIVGFSFFRPESESMEYLQVRSRHARAAFFIDRGTFPAATPGCRTGRFSARFHLKSYPQVWETQLPLRQARRFRAWAALSTHPKG
jgi:pimeloyl-ACP methyl ester carboxylesterase